MIRVAFICTGNSCRSQISEGFGRHLAREGVEVWSAGVAPIGLNPRTVAVMKEAGINISKHTSKSLEALPKDLDYVITVCGNANKLCPQLPARVERLHWDIPDPKVQGSEEEVLADFRLIRETIRGKVLEFFRGRNLLRR